METINPEKYHHWKEEEIQILCLARLQTFLHTTIQIYREILIIKTGTSSDYKNCTTRDTDAPARHVQYDLGRGRNTKNLETRNNYTTQEMSESKDQ